MPRGLSCNRGLRYHHTTMFRKFGLGIALAAMCFGAIVALDIPLTNAGSLGEPVFFESAVYPPTPFKVKKAKEQGVELETKAGATITGNLYRPDGTGAFPVVILMHGCGGMGRWNDVWRRRLVDWGYVVLDMDSFGPRGIENGVCFSSDVAGPFSRALDAHGARSFLATLPFVAPKRIGVMGMSHGGMSVLQAINRSTTTKIDGEPFRAAVALYPSCDPNTRPDAPILILAGELDNWTDPKSCERYLAKLGRDHDVTLKVYPGAYHAFDVAGVDTLVRGHYVVRYDREAAKDAMKRMRAFLGKHLELAP